MSEISIIDYGLGNISAFARSFELLRVDYDVISERKDLKNSNRLILPGVGSFDWAMKLLKKTEINKMLDELVLEKNIPVLGVCVGMQIMCRSSSEGSEDGLGWFNLDVKKIPESNSLRLPHMGWGDLILNKNNEIFKDINNPKYYFLHSYYVEDTANENTIATVDYGNNLTAAIQKENIFGCQFHPEKSHNWGLQLLQNFSSYGKN